MMHKFPVFSLTSHVASISVGVALAIVALPAAPTVAQDRTIVFSTSDEGVSKSIPTWGLDTAWLDPANVRRGVIFMGKPQVDVIRFSFTPYEPLVNGDYGKRAQEDFDKRMEIVNTYTEPDTALYLNFHGPIDNVFKDKNHNVLMGPYSEVIDLTRRKCEAAGRKVVSVAPFNEPDFDKEQGDVSKLRELCEQLLKKGVYGHDKIRLYGPSTLNCDEANVWYEPLKDVLDEGNTHQLAGSFDKYAAFYENVEASGDLGCNDELHNVMEAMVGAEYGMDAGIWWGSAEYARGEFVKASDGKRLGYAEHRPNWTAASVYRAPDGRIQAFGGASERQATTTDYQIVVKDRAVFFDGHGPQRSYTLTVVGGAEGYWNNQSSFEKVVNITWGEDPQPVIDGVYAIVARHSGEVMEAAGDSTSRGVNIVQNIYRSGTNQQWEVIPVSPRNGDASYFTIRPANSSMSIDIDGWSMDDGANLQQWDAGLAPNQQWILEYVEDGWFRIRSRWNGKYLEVADSSTEIGANVQQWEGTGNKNQQWRFVPADSAVEFTKPDAPADLEAKAGAASVRLSWSASAAGDLAGYNIYRSLTPEGPYEMIAREVTDLSYIDNSANHAQPYHYKIRAVDRSLNRSEYTAAVSAKPTGAKTMIAHYPFDSSPADRTGNGNDGTVSGTTAYVPGRVGPGALVLDSSTYVQLPPDIADFDALTIAGWVNWNGGSNWQRIFDFGNGTEQYIYLSPSNGDGKAQLTLKNGEAESVLKADGIPGGRWTHFAVTLSGKTARLYVNGAEVASSDSLEVKNTDFKPVVNTIGKSQYSADAIFNGRVDDFRIYNYALGADEIKTLAGPQPKDLEPDESKPAAD